MGNAATLAEALAGCPYWRKVHAHMAVADAIASGVLRRAEKCQLCGTLQGPSGKVVVYHHHSYDPEHWLTLDEVCASCHRGIHGGRIPEPRTGRLNLTDAQRRRLAYLGGEPARTIGTPRPSNAELGRRRQALRLATAS